MRITDDLADGTADNVSKRLDLEQWRGQLTAALAGEDSHALHPALRQTVASFGIPPRYLEDVLDGVTMDLDGDRYQTFADLYPYCYRVASAVGLACIHIWGFEGAAPWKPPKPPGLRCSSRTSCATWARTPTAAGSTCRRRTCSATGTTRTP